MKHSDYVDLIRNWLESEKYIHLENIPVGGKFPDIVALKSKEVTSIEVKVNAQEITKAIGQCLFHSLESNKLFVSIPLNEYELVPENAKKIMKENNIGILGCNKNNVKILINSKYVEKNNSSLIEKINEKIKNGVRPAIRDQKDFIRELKKSLSIQPMTIDEISKYLGIHRVTASKYLAVMEAKGIVKRRDIGKAKLYSVK